MSLRFVNYVILLASSVRDLQRALGRFAVECEDESQHLQVCCRGSLTQNGELLTPN